jgi:hypothetical protein
MVKGTDGVNFSYHSCRQLPQLFLHLLHTEKADIKSECLVHLMRAIAVEIQF